MNAALYIRVVYTMNYEYVEKVQKSCAIIPCYVKGIGKVTKICYKDGGYEYVNYSVNKVINDYCALNLRCIKSIKAICQKVTERKSLIPLYIKEDVLFMPVKTIKPCMRGDGCIGYINIRYIKELDFSNNIIKLLSGQNIEFLERKETIKRRIADCTIIKSKIIVK